MTRRTKAAVVIQRFTRNYLSRPMCPLLFERVQKPFFLCQNYVFSASELARYVQTSGKIIHPVTQAKLSRKDLDDLSIISGIDLSQDALNEIAKKLKEEEEKASLCQYYLEENLKIGSFILEQCRRRNGTYISKVVTICYVYVPHLVKSLMDSFVHVCDETFIELVKLRLHEQIKIASSSEDYYKPLLNTYDTELRKMFDCLCAMSSTT